MKLDSDLEPQYTVMYADPQYTVMYADPKHCIYDVKQWGGQHLLCRYLSYIIGRNSSTGTILARGSAANSFLAPVQCAYQRDENNCFFVSLCLLVRNRTQPLNCMALASPLE